MRAPISVDLRPVRVAGAAMLGAAALLPLLPAAPPFLCPLRRVTGVPCPFCGMTRSVSAAVRGDLGASLLLNPAGILIVLAAVTLVVAWRWRRVTVPAWAVVAIFVVLWTYQLFKYTTGRPI